MAGNGKVRLAGVALLIVAACGEADAPSSSAAPVEDAGLANEDATAPAPDDAAGGPGPADAAEDGGADGASKAPADASQAGDATDAGTTDDGPWPAAHYPLPQFVDLGGRVIASPKLVTVTFAGDTHRDALRLFAAQFVADSYWWQDVTQGFGVKGVPTNTNVELPDTLSNTTTETSQLKAMVQKLATSGALPAPDLDTIYLLYIPLAANITIGGAPACLAFGAYHDSVTIAQDGGTFEAAFGVILDCPPPGQQDAPMSWFTRYASHEAIEAATDPEPNLHPAWRGVNDAWFGAYGTENEVADVCATEAPYGFGEVTDGHGNVLSRSWDDGAAAASHDPCQPVPGTSYYGLAVPTQPLPGKNDGYVVVASGATTTLDAVFFSDVKLPGDAQLLVGADGQPTQPIAAGIQATLSQPAAHNGVHVTLGIQVHAGTPSGDYRAVARSSLSGTDYHDWPFIVHVP